MMKQIIIYSRIESGHIEAYKKFYLKLFEQIGYIPIEKKSVGKYLWKNDIFFPSVETSIKEFTLCTFLGIFNRRIVSGIYIFRPARFGGLTLKKIPSILMILYFFIIRCISNAKVISIVSSEKAGWRAPGFSDFLEDPQLWDMYNGRRNSSLLPSDIILFAGHASLNKGFPVFLEVTKIAKKMECRIVGEIQNEVRHLDLSTVSKYSCLLYVSETDLINAIENAKFIWCVYSENYDQSSGIFGRAIQLGRIPIVRKGSYLEMLSIRYNFAVIVLDLDLNLFNLEEMLLKITNEDYRRLSNKNIESVGIIARSQYAKYLKLFGN